MKQEASARAKEVFPYRFWQRSLKHKQHVRTWGGDGPVCYNRTVQFGSEGKVATRIKVRKSL